MHQLGVVDDLLRVEHVEILLEELPDRDPLRATRVRAGGDDVLGVHPELPGLGHHRAHLGGERAGAEGAVQAVRPRHPPGLPAAGQRLPDPELLLGCGQQSQRRGQRIGVGEPPHQGVAEGVEGEHHRRHHRATLPGRDPGPQIGRRLAGEGEHQHPVRGDSAVHDPVDHRLHQRRGLARPRTGQHQQRTTGVVHDGPLERVELGRGQRLPLGSDEGVHEAFGCICGVAYRCCSEIPPRATDSALSSLAVHCALRVLSSLLARRRRTCLLARLSRQNRRSVLGRSRGSSFADAHSGRSACPADGRETSQLSDHGRPTHPIQGVRPYLFAARVGKRTPPAATDQRNPPVVGKRTPTAARDQRKPPVVGKRTPTAARDQRKPPVVGKRTAHRRQGRPAGARYATSRLPRTAESTTTTAAASSDVPRTSSPSSANAFTSEKVRGRRIRASAATIVTVSSG